MDLLVVSWIQVGGLAVSLYGFFYLSMGLFGNDSIRVFRPLLPASSMAICGLLVVDLSTLFPKSSIFRFPGPPLLWSCAFFVIGFVFAVIAEIAAANPSEWAARVVKRLDKFLIRFLMFFLLGNLFEFILIGIHQGGLQHLLSSSSSAPYVLLALPLLLILFALAFAVLSPRYLTVDRLKLSGFIFSVLGILTSFLPAILEVAGISVH